MRRDVLLSLQTLMLLSLVTLLGGCGSAKKEGAADPVATPTTVGSASCVNICHAVTRDLTEDPVAGRTIQAKWQGTTHTTVSGVQCENCHGGGSLHRGIGPIPFPNPQAARCAQASCHPAIPGGSGSALSEFDATRHANGNRSPDAAFTQIATPVSAGRHVEECSRCHNPNQRFEFDFQGNITKPSLSSLPDSAVSCASCHDGHEPQLTATIPQRVAAVGYPLFRKFLVSGVTGQQVNAGASGAQYLAGNVFQSVWAVQPNGSVDFTAVQATPRISEVKPDMLCAACHTKGVYKNSGQATHQDDIHTQWALSGHGDRNAAAFARFSADPPAYIDPSGNPYPVSSRTAYPYDMGLTVVGATATTSRNAGSNNYACFKCHQGLASLAYQDNVEGTPAAPVLFGDSTVTCVTCHDPHRDVPGNSRNTRKPQVMTKYASAQVTFSGNVFLDNTQVPTEAGNETICIFCHQGRESGFTLFKRRLAAGTTITGNFLNEHYLGTGGMLWARNAYEYGGKQYGGVTPHQQTNCNGCHMARTGRNDLAGHSWRIFAESDGALANASCNASSCHNGRVPNTRTGLFSFRDTVFDPTNDYDGDGAQEGIAEEIRDLAIQLRDLLQANGVFYNDLAYPYFFANAAFTTSFSNWTLPTFKAAFNLQYVIKGLPSQPTSQVGQPNNSAATHNYRYNIQILRDSYDDLRAANPAAGPDRSGQPRPSGTRPATNYDPQTGGAYNPRQ